MTYKTAYSYNENKEFVGECKAWQSPLEKDVYHLPADATYKKPLEQKEDHKVIWNGKSWEYQEIPKPKPEPEPIVLTFAQKREQEYYKQISSSDFQEAYFEKEFEGKAEKLKLYKKNA